MLKTMIDFWGKFPLLGKTFVLLLVGASLFVLANKVFDNRPLKIEKFYPNTEMAKAELLRLVPLGEEFVALNNVLLISRARLFVHDKIENISQKDMGSYRVRDSQAVSLSIHGIDWTDYLNGKSFVWAKIFGEYDASGKLINIEVMFGFSPLEWAI